MTRGLFLDYAERAGLEITSQQYLDWEGHRHLDCLSSFKKPINSNVANPIDTNSIAKTSGTGIV